ncbi:hypothetical protein GZ78_22250 [Endozoicomonas numazuensis]|uniref:Uncharacterized protein n=2 Tax=Endozoicomonas numazuensis TaxID=1137799 RepID=A0A081NDN7_9GAMM|nr:hypothetical protein GZ78_22250 [Endozoicomonas numazuensis]
MNPKDERAIGYKQSSPPPQRKKPHKLQGRGLESIQEDVELKVSQEQSTTQPRLGSPSPKPRRAKKVETRQFLNPEKGRILLRHRSLGEVIALLTPVPLPERGYVESEVIDDRREAMFTVLSMASSIQILQQKGKSSKVKSTQLLSKAEIQNLVAKLFDKRSDAKEMKQDLHLHKVPDRLFKDISHNLAHCDSPEMLSVLIATAIQLLKKQLPPTDANHEVLAYIFLYLCVITGQNPETIDVSQPLDDEDFMKSIIPQIYNRDQSPPKGAHPMLTQHLNNAKEVLTTKKTDLSGTMPLSEANEWLTDENIEDDPSDWD